MIIVNLGPEDYHLHSNTFSDGLNSVDEIVKMAWEFGLKKIAITDHSQAVHNYYDWKGRSSRTLIQRWKNIHNDLEVIFGIEGDLLNEEGDICDTLKRQPTNFLILSAHDKIYTRDKTKITEAYLKAIERHHSKIKFLSHPCIEDFEKYIDIQKVTKAANDHKIPLELNCANLEYGKTNLTNLQIMLREAERIYVNSDAHTLWELKTFRQKGFEFLKKEEFMV